MFSQLVNRSIIVYLVLILGLIWYKPELIYDHKDRYLVPVLVVLTGIVAYYITFYVSIQ